MPYLWDDEAWQDYLYWVAQDKNTARRINALLKDFRRTGGLEKGFGKPEFLRHSSEGLSSVRIDAKNRLTYKVEGNTVRIVSCKGHYSDK